MASKASSAAPKATPKLSLKLNRAIQIKDTRSRKNPVAGVPFTSLRSFQNDNLKKLKGGSKSALKVK